MGEPTSGDVYPDDSGMAPSSGVVYSDDSGMAPSSGVVYSDDSGMAPSSGVVYPDSSPSPAYSPSPYGSEAPITYGPSSGTLALEEPSPMKQEQMQVAEEETETCCCCFTRKKPPPPTPGQIYRKKVLVIVAQVVGFILNIVSLIFAISAWLDIRAYTNEFASIVDTWTLPPLMNISMQVGSCPAGFSSFSTVTWGGLYPACNCQYENDPNRTLTDDPAIACSSDKLQYNCVTMPGSPNVYSPFWNGSYSFCYQFLGPSTLDRPKYDDATGTCPEGSQLCGDPTAANTTGDNSTLFCYPTNYTCPITDLWVMELNATNNGTVDQVASQTLSLPPIVAGSYAVFYRRGGALRLPGTERSTQCTNPPGDKHTNVCPISLYGFPLIRLTIASGLPCYLGDGHGWPGRGSEYSSQQNNYKALTHSINPAYNYNAGYVPRTTDSGCDDQMDNRYISIASRTEQSLFGQNVSSTNTYIAPPSGSSQIPVQYLTTNSYYRYHFSYETEAQWSDTCAVDRQRIYNNSHDVMSLQKAQLALFVFTIFTFIVVGVAGCILTIQVVWKDNDGDIKPGEEGYAPMCGLKVTKYFMKVAMYSCVIASVVLAFGLVGVFHKLNDATTPGASCTDTITQNSFTKLTSILDGLSKKNVIQGFSNLFDAITEVVDNVVRNLF